MAENDAPTGGYASSARSVSDLTPPPHGIGPGVPRNAEDPHVATVRAYLDNAGITPETLRYAATHEALCRSWIFDLLTNLADVMEADPSVIEPGSDQPA